MNNWCFLIVTIFTFLHHFPCPVNNQFLLYHLNTYVIQPLSFISLQYLILTLIWNWDYCRNTFLLSLKSSFWNPKLTDHLLLSSILHAGGIQNSLAKPTRPLMMWSDLSFWLFFLITVPHCNFQLYQTICSSLNMKFLTLLPVHRLPDIHGIFFLSSIILSFLGIFFPNFSTLTSLLIIVKV